MTQHRKTPKEIKAAAYFAIATMILLGIVGLKVFVTEPRVITNHEIVMLPNDSLSALREELAATKAENDILRTTAEIRAQIIYNISGPMQAVTDSMLTLMRTSLMVMDSSRNAMDKDRQVRAARYAALTEQLERMSNNAPAIQSLFEDQRTTITHMLARHDTIYATLPDERRNFWGRLSYLFKPKK